MSNAQKKREAAEAHNKAVEESKKPVARVVRKASRVNSSMILAMVMGFGKH